MFQARDGKQKITCLVAQTNGKTSGKLPAECQLMGNHPVNVTHSLSTDCLKLWGPEFINKIIIVVVIVIAIVINSNSSNRNSNNSTPDPGREAPSSCTVLIRTFH